jgi:hypothetical protein
MISYMMCPVNAGAAGLTAAEEIVSGRIGALAPRIKVVKSAGILAPIPGPVRGAWRWLQAHATHEWLVACAGSIVSVGAYIWYAQQGLTLAYLDGISHMSIAHRVLSGRSPGLAQLGPVWLPLNHILMLPLVWNETLYRDGFAGSFPSMVAFVLAAVYMYRTAHLLFGSVGAGWIAALVLMLNPSVVYMQSTPMSEMDLIFCAVVAVFYAVRWARTFHPADLVLAAVATAAGTLVRYDAWALALGLIVVVALVALRKRGRIGAEANMLLFGLLGFAGCAAWVVYEQVIFGDPLAFYNGPYSAKAQEQHISQVYGLPTYHNLLLSLRVYGQTVLDTAWWPLTLLAILGLLVWIVTARLHVQNLPVYVVLVPFAFNWLSLVLGISVIETPEIPLNGTPTYLNERYGMMMLPAIAIFLAALAVWRRVLLVGVLGLVIAFSVTPSIGTPPYALQEPVHGVTSQGRQQQIQEAQFLDSHYRGGTVLVGGAPFTPLMFYSGLPSTAFLTDADGSTFQQALAQPQSWAQWIVVDPASNSYDAVWAALGIRHDWQKSYVLRQTIGTVQIYERIGS